jgi:hypothetical protein
VKILIAVWGENYIRRFEKLSLSSVLAEHNLPYLSKDCDVELVFLTKREDFAGFEDLDLMDRVKSYAKTRYVAIDDLVVPGLYTVTLTLAFTRGMRVFGSDMTRCYFVYWNADFVLGNGTLGHLLDCIQQGRNVVLAGSVRVVSEEVEPLLQAHMDEDGVLSASSRELTSYLFQHPHLMQVAKTVNQDFCWAEYPNHMFWDVDHQTIIARFFQIFMFCLRPSVARDSIDGYCDYSFVPAFCPGEPIHVVGDSDQVCLLEMQGRWQEADAIHFGDGRHQAWTRNIDEWCTVEHAAIARHPIVYHAGDLPPDLPLMLADSDIYVERMVSNIRPPAEYPGHYYWIHGVAAWRLRRDPQQMLAGWPPELDRRLPVGHLKHPSFHYHLNNRARTEPHRPASLLGRIFRRLVGDPPAITRLHPDAAALDPLVRAAQEARDRLDENPTHRTLVVADLGCWVDQLFAVRHPRIYRTEPLVTSSWLLQPEPPVDDIVVYHVGGGHDLESTLKNVSGALRPGGRLIVLCHYPLDRPYDSDAVSLDRLGFAVSPYDGKAERLHFAGSGRVRYARRLRAHVERIRRGPGGLLCGFAGVFRDLAAGVLGAGRQSVHVASVFTALGRGLASR